MKHLVLIVEDDPAAAHDLSEVVASMDADVVLTDNYTEALRLVSERDFCTVLLDLEIKRDSDSIKGHRVHGTALIREIRSHYGGKHGSSFRTPIVVVSGHANEVDAAVTMMKDGADDIIRKPLNLHELETRVRAAFNSAGRSSHAECAAAVVRANERNGLVLRISGERKGERALVTIADRTAPLTAGAMKVLLQLAIAFQERRMVSKEVLGAKQHEGFRAISRLREQLRTAGDRGDIIANDRRGGYSLRSEVTVVACNAEALKALEDKDIDRLAAQLEALLAGRA